MNDKYKKIVQETRNVLNMKNQGEAIMTFEIEMVRKVGADGKYN